MIASRRCATWARASSAALLAMSLASSAGASPLAEARSGALASVKACEVRYRVYPAADAARGPAVLIAHGFLRSGEFMAGWAEAFARAGTPAVAVDLCASALAGGRHADNGADLVALRRALGIEAVIYVGVSAGGLAAMIAASQDEHATRGVLLLDPTNAGGQARTAAARVRAPVAALVAKPQMCNAWRNIDPALATLRDATIVRMDGASHCDFEWPTDNFCRVACLAAANSDGDRRNEARIRAVGLAFVDAIARADPGALAQWKGGIGETLR